MSSTPQAGGTLGAANDSVSLGVMGMGSLGVQIEGTFSGTLSFEGALEGTYVALNMHPPNSTTSVTTATTTGVWVGSIGGLRNVRVRMSSYASGAAKVSLQAAAVALVLATGAGGAVDSVAGTVNQITASPTTGDVILTLPATLIAPGTIAASNLSGTNTGDQTISLLGDASGSGTGNITVINVNLPTGVTQAGVVLATTIAEPTTPSAGKDRFFASTVDKRFHDKNEDGTIGTTVVADTGSANNFLTAISAAGVISKAQPTEANLSLSDITTNNVTSSAHGLAPKSPGNAEVFLDGGATPAWTAPMKVGRTVTSGTAGSLLYVGSGPVLAQDNANLFWNVANNRLGIGTTGPIAALEITTAQTDVSCLGLSSNLTWGSVITDQLAIISGSSRILPVAALGTVYGMLFLPSVGGATANAITQVFGLYARVDTGATYTGTITTAKCLGIGDSSKGGTAVISNQYGIDIADLTTATGLNLGIVSGVNAGAGKYALFFYGTGPSYINGKVGLGEASPSAWLHLSAGTATANTGPLKFTSGTLLTSPEAGSVEFLTDAYYVTTTTGTKRRMITAGTTGRSTGQTAAVASVATYTLGAADATYEVSANVLVTTSGATYSFTVTCAYTDEGNTARTLTLSFTRVAGTLQTTIANGESTVPYMGMPQHLRCKASTAITIATTGVFTNVTYSVEGVIRQTA